jgi:hypothetical protein
MAERILLLAPRFYGVEKTIESVLREMHYDVTCIENKILPFDFHSTNSKFKFLRKIWFLLFSPQKRYLREKFKKTANLKFDILFSINAHIICPYLFRKLKTRNPELFSVLYLWDSSSMYDWTNEHKLFNKVYTFDHADSVRFKIQYQPNFYIQDRINITHNDQFDLFFIGKFTPERFAIIDKIAGLPETSGLNFFVKLWPGYRNFVHYHFIYILFKVLNFKNIWIKNYLVNYEAVEGKITRDYIISESLDYYESQSHLLCSNVILDLPYQRQSGYTHRFIEALANGKKIITLNSNASKEDFYNPEQIHFLNNQNPEIDKKWVEERLTFPVSNYFSGLELTAWLKSVLNVGIA